MKEIGYFFAKVRYKLAGNKRKIISDYFRKSGMSIGNGCTICCNIMTTEPYLIEIGDRVVVSGNVKFVTHDYSISRVDSSFPNLFGYIKIGNNCFIGQNSTVMYGVTLPNNVIVASGSVVANSFDEERIIIGGNPAHIIGRWSDFAAKYAEKAMSRTELLECIKKGETDRLVRRSVKK